MKTKLLIFSSAMMMAISFGAYAQAPEKFNYQGIARDSNGEALANQALGLQISILNPSNTAVYVEEHSVTTNAFGLYRVVIGDGSAVTGSMGAINWASGTKKIKVEIDPNGGTSYTSLGTTELLSVPYALYSAQNGESGWKTNGNSAGSNDFIGTTNNQALRFKVNNTAAGIIASNNTAFGQESLEANTTGFDNSAYGNDALKANTTGSSNVAVGTTALDANTTGGLNVAVGVNALGANEEGKENTAVGTSAMADNLDSDYNVAVGRHALKSLLAGNKNTALGYRSLYSSTLASENTAVGAEALEDNTSGYENVAMGHLALSSNTSGYQNVAIGAEALKQATIRRNNIAIGFQAMNTTATWTPANNNVAIGSLSEVDGGNNISIGYASGIFSGGNVVVLGNSTSAHYVSYDSWYIPSDIRAKKDVKPHNHGLDFITKLEPIMYHYDIGKQNEFIYGKERAEEIFPKEEWGESIRKKESTWFSGFSAQQVAKAAEEIGYDFHGVDVPDNENELYTVSYSQFVVPLVKAVQEQQQMIQDQIAVNDAQQQIIEQLQQKIAELEEMITD